MPPSAMAARSGAAGGLLATMLALAAAETLVRTVPTMTHPGPAGVLAPAYLAVTFTAFKGGLRWGLASATLVAAFAFYFFSVPGLLNFTYTDHNLAFAFVVALSSYGTAALVGIMKRAADEASEARLDAERRHARVLQERNRALAQANESLHAFTYMVSHDLKEPLRGIDGYLAALQEDHGPDLARDARHIVEQAQRASRRLGVVLEGLLEFSRATTGQIGRLQPIRVGEVLRDEACVARYKAIVDDRRARVEYEADGDDTVQGTVPALAQVLGNLVVNAVKHNPDPAPWVQIRSEPVQLPEGRFVDILVEDNGPGLPRHVVNRLRSPEGDVPAGAVGSSGFGLVIARRAAERIGATLDPIDRAEGEGAAFRIRVPAAPPSPQGDSPGAHAPGPASGRGAAPNGRESPG